MIVGYVCFVFKARTPDVAEQIAFALAQALQGTEASKAADAGPKHGHVRTDSI